MRTISSATPSSRQQKHLDLEPKPINGSKKEKKGDIIGKNPNDEAFKVSKDGGEIDAITASTITSRAFLLAVKRGYLAYKTACEPKGPVVADTTGATKSTPEKETQEKDIKTPKSK